MNIWVFIISIVVVSSMLIALNAEDMYYYFTYVHPIKTVEISDAVSIPHADPFKIDIDEQNNPIPIKTVEYIAEDNSVNITFGGGKSFSKHFGDIPDFTYTQNFNLNQTFVFRCDERHDFTFLGFYKYLGIYMINGDPAILFWHYEGHTYSPLTCNYPKIIMDSIDLVDYDYASISDALLKHPFTYVSRTTSDDSSKTDFELLKEAELIEEIKASARIPLSSFYPMLNNEHPAEFSVIISQNLNGTGIVRGSAPDYSLEVLSQGATYAISGEVQQIVPTIVTRYNTEYVFSDVKIEVEEDIFGEYDEKFITVRIQGGQVEDVKTVSHIDASFDEGEHVLVFIAGPAEPESIWGDNYYVAGMLTGKYTIDDFGKAEKQLDIEVKNAEDLKDEIRNYRSDKNE